MGVATHGEGFSNRGIEFRELMPRIAAVARAEGRTLPVETELATA
ncbi:MAG: hypothetical protein ACRDJH_27425 [Thermomicrobiales bacterium]